MTTSSTAAQHADLVAAFDAVDPEQLRARPCSKWRLYPEEVLPMWVADMDLPVADPIKEALVDRIRADDLGYPCRPAVDGLIDSVVARLHDRHGLDATPEAVLPLSGIIAGLWVGASVCTGPGEEVVIQPPVYPPFATVITQAGRRPLENPMVSDGGRYRLDLDGLRAVLTPATRAIMICNPHNPVGRCFSRGELEALAEVVLEHRLWVISDELHADLVYDGAHVPFASLSPEVAQRTITLYGPTKAFNVAGMSIGFAIATNAALLERLRTAFGYLLHPPSGLAQHAALAAYRHGDAWLDAALAYLRGNRDHLAARLANEAPAIVMTPPEATYLAWLDLRALGLGADPHAAVLEAGLGLSDGRPFGAGGDGFVRLNFATSRRLLDVGIDRLVAVAREHAPAPA